MKKDICFIFNVIVEQFDEYSLQLRKFYSSQEEFIFNDIVIYDSMVELNDGSEIMSMGDIVSDKNVDLDDGLYDYVEVWLFDYYEEINVGDDSFNIGD